MGDDCQAGVGSGEAVNLLPHPSNKADALGGQEATTSPMRVIERGVYRGPHLYSLTPMIRIKLDLGTLEEWPSHRLPGFTERLLALLPGLHEHGCSFHERGGFVRRLEEGTWLGHVAEHIALELQTLIGSRVTRGKTRSVKGEFGVYNVMYAYRDDNVGLVAGRLALQLVDSLLPPELQGITGLDRIYKDEDEPAFRGAFDLRTALKALRYVHRRTALGPTTMSLVQEAERRGIPVLRLDDQSLVQLGTGRYQKRIRASITSMTSSIATDAAGDKDLTKTLLAHAGLPVPRGEVVRNGEDAVRAAERIGYPVVVKPLDGNHGRGVSIDLSTPEEVTRAFGEAVSHSRRVIVENCFKGRDHRILVVNGEVVAVAERLPAHVIGDGERSISALVEEVNKDPRRGDGHENVMTRITIGDHARAVLAKSGLSPESVPDLGQVVYLCDTANLSTGGTAIDRTDDIHPDNAMIARRAARTIGLDVAGIDFIAPDITRSVHETGGGIIEVNAAPGFRMHLQPSEGRARNVARPVMDMLFPRGTPTRIPVLAITGTNGKSTTSRMVGHILRANGLCVGLTSTTGIYMNGRRVVEADASGPWSARVVLKEPTVDVAVLETARGGILREGMGFSECDVGLVTNIQPDHLGLKGIETIEDLAWVKSVVVEAVHRNGTSILNADDPMCVSMRRRAGGRICYFSLRGGADMPDFLREHIEDGGFAVVREPGALDGGEIVIHDDGDSIHLMRAAEIPATLDGLAEFNVQNALGAVAMAYAQGVAVNVIRNALSTFTTSFEQSPGRLNVFDGHGFRVILDYAHNPAGLQALGDLILKMRPRHRRIIGMINIPGDRRDDDMREMGALATRYFDEIIFREDPARRGRKPGEIVALLAEGALATGFPEERITRILDEDEAADVCLSRAQPGDLVVLTPTDVEAMWQQVLDFRATPSTFFDVEVDRAEEPAEGWRRTA
ncbi:cyanophycin synthetase [Microvirga sp. CF3062]|uniref:cyanophycin synthetase n=1 Tax=Microvirga sp. CF3062 TaxID=3110182 RepID=UPI002E76AE87|nr:cyanophycin synthetase [Microvirga sp. CF3062]MEE1656162.1 cyanophycin synthetase [Microvirga sp. CF3062]